MACVSKSKNRYCLLWTLLLIFGICWLTSFLIIWFVIEPAAFHASTSATIFYALLFLAIFFAFYSIFYCCFKCCEEKRTQEHYTKKVQDAFPPLEAGVERPESTKIAYISRKERPTSKRVLIPKVPEAKKNEGDVIYTPGDSNRDSTITIPLFVEDSWEVKTRFVTKQELYFDGDQFLNTEC